jgi:hypothetical protein
MMHTIDYETLANESAGNWAKFNCFAWFDRPEDADQFCIVYTCNRDSDILDKANAMAIAAELAPFIKRGSVIPQRHSHWACGHVDGYAIKVFDKRGRITKAFKVWCDLQAKMQEYPILDESLYSELEMEAQEESWELWARADFVRAVERCLDVELDDSDSSAVLTAFEAIRERANVYWEGDEIDVERIAQAATTHDVRGLIVPVFLTVYRDGHYLCTGTITGDEWECHVTIYEDEWFACLEAHDSGLESVTIGQHVYTWEAI